MEIKAAKVSGQYINIWFIRGMNKSYIEFLMNKKGASVSMTEIKGDKIGFFFSEEDALKSLVEGFESLKVYPYLVVYPMNDGIFKQCVDQERERWFKRVGEEYKEMTRIEHEEALK